MKIQHTEQLTIIFEIQKECGFEDGKQISDPWWVITFTSIEPKGTFKGINDTPDKLKCAYCTGTNAEYLCDAHAVEKNIQSVGPEEFLSNLGVQIEEGTLTVKGRMTWIHCSTTDGEYWDEEFEVGSVKTT